MKATQRNMHVLARRADAAAVRPDRADRRSVSSSHGCRCGLSPAAARPRPAPRSISVPESGQAAQESVRPWRGKLAMSGRCADQSAVLLIGSPSGADRLAGMGTADGSQCPLLGATFVQFASTCSVPSAADGQFAATITQRGTSFAADGSVAITWLDLQHGHHRPCATRGPSRPPGNRAATGALHIKQE